ILKKIEYSEFEEEDNVWKFKEVTLEKVNLLVGQNATGKTRTITVISWLANMLAGLQPQLLSSGNYTVEFSDNNDIYQYLLKIKQHKVLSEKLIFNGDVKVERNADGTGELFAEAVGNGQMIKFKISENQLIVFSKKDAIQHPYLEKLFEWANGVRLYAFGTPLGKDSGFAVNDINQLQVNPRDTNGVAALFRKGAKDFGEGFRNNIIELMGKIGYNLKDINVAPNPNVGLMPTGLPLQMIYVIEKGRTSRIFQPEMSQGMFRALSLLIQIRYNLRKKSSTTVLVDDIGEGLDFERSSGIIKVIVDAAEDSEIQFVMSTNDRFVMNYVPLKYWQVIKRKGGECVIYNYGNSKDIFDEFEFTGLSNFSFLSTDFISQELESKTAMVE
ncbi:MAG: ATP-binding protein, partial [Bacteroidales bacterium]|nr:ATP-binding protein [Bacteroidales bacterium]